LQKELELWRQTAKEIAAKTKKTFVIANNHNGGKAAVNALELISMLTGHKVQVPLPLVERYPELERIAFIAE